MKSVRFALRANAFTCFTFGLLLALVPAHVGVFLGNFPPLALWVLGVLLGFHSIHLVIGSSRKKVSEWEVYYFSFGDLAWYLGSLLILISTEFVTTHHGTWAMLGVAVMVLLIGMSQLWTFSEATVAGLPSSSPEQPTGESGIGYLPSEYSRLKAIVVSWLGLKNWVKVWVTMLNLVFLSALFLLPDHFAKVVLASYFGTIPLVISIVIVERGLSRIVGVGHLVTWLPLMVYISLRLTGDIAGPQIARTEQPNLFAYAIVIFFATGACLAFDFYDIFWWIMGQRERVGSPADRSQRTM